MHLTVQIAQYAAIEQKKMNIENERRSVRALTFAHDRSLKRNKYMKKKHKHTQNKYMTQCHATENL